MSIRQVVDVSHHNKIIDWDTFAQTDMHAIIRCGYGSNSTSQDDRMWERNIEAVERLAIPHGVYFYSYATSVSEIQSEIDHCLRLIDGRQLQYPVYFDAEEPGTQSVSRECADIFCQAMADHGFMPGVYASDSWFMQYMRGLGDWTKWVARYSQAKPATPCDMWQYTSSGRASGVPSAAAGVDMSYCYRDFPAELGDDDMITKEQMIEIAQLTAQYVGGAPCIINPHGLGELVYFDGGHTLVRLSDPDQVEARNMVENMTKGHDIPIFEMGADDAPWFDRLVQLCGYKSLDEIPSADANFWYHNAIAEKEAEEKAKQEAENQSDPNEA